MTTELQPHAAQLPVVPDVPTAQIKWLAEVRQHPARAMMAEELQTAFKAVFVKIAGHVEPPDKLQQDAFISTFQEGYPNLNPIECVAAIKMSLTGKFGTGDDAKHRIFYGDKFSVSTMCAILNAYQEWRQKIVAAIVSAEDEARREQERQARDEAWAYLLEIDKKDFLNGEYVYRVVKYAKPNKQEPYVVIMKPTTWEDIPPYWFDWAIEEKLLTWGTGEKHKRIEAARKEAENELSVQNENTRQSGRINEVIAGDKFTQSVELRAKVIQRKRAIWDKLIQAK